MLKSSENIRLVQINQLLSILNYSCHVEQVPPITELNILLLINIVLEATKTFLQKAYTHALILVKPTACIRRLLSLQVKILRRWSEGMAHSHVRLTLNNDSPRKQVSRVIWQRPTTASPPHTHLCNCIHLCAHSDFITDVTPINFPFPCVDLDPQSNTRFFWPTRACLTNSISIGSSVFAQLACVPNTETTLRATCKR